MVELAATLFVAIVLGFMALGALLLLLSCLGALTNSVDTSNRDRVIKQYAEREERGEPRPNGGPWFAPSYLEQRKRENR
jgi:hypothetical protein